MTTERRQGGAVVFICDTCEATLETHTDEFEDANNIRKREGWKAEKIGKDWVHGCQDCGT